MAPRKIERLPTRQCNAAPGTADERLLPVDPSAAEDNKEFTQPAA